MNLSQKFSQSFSVLLSFYLLDITMSSDFMVLEFSLVFKINTDSICIILKLSWLTFSQVLSSRQMKDVERSEDPQMFLHVYFYFSSLQVFRKSHLVEHGWDGEMWERFKAVQVVSVWTHTMKYHCLLYLPFQIYGLANTIELNFQLTTESKSEKNKYYE